MGPIPIKVNVIDIRGKDIYFEYLGPAVKLHSFNLVFS